MRAIGGAHHEHAAGTTGQERSDHVGQGTGGADVGDDCRDGGGIGEREHRATVEREDVAGADQAGGAAAHELFEVGHGGAIVVRAALVLLRPPGHRG
ncbi:MAG: hypothetical protein IPN32_32385 [Deltaproteobacteria bacterium]|nr:hypothetical protein [Deltaproteobacteria bacterium]